MLLEAFADDLQPRAAGDPVRDGPRCCWSAAPAIGEISFAAPNKHHFLVDLAPFGLDNPGEVFIAADRPYGLIEATVRQGARMTLEEFNALPEAEARERLAACLDVPRWVDTVLAGRPYADVGARCSAVAPTRPPTSTTTSSRPRWPGTPGSASGPAPATTRRTPLASSPASTTPTPTSPTRLAAGNRAYEERFDRVFLIRAAGRTGAGDPGRAGAAARQRRRRPSADETVTQLREIALLRLEQVVG